jgi:hypothetical protein
MRILRSLLTAVLVATPTATAATPAGDATAAPPAGDIAAAATRAADTPGAGGSHSPWSTPATIPGTPDDASPVIAQSASGPIAVYWETIDQTLPLTSSSINSYVSPLGPGLLPEQARELSPPLNSGPAVIYDHGQLAIASPDDVATGPIAGPLRLHPMPALVRALAGDTAGDLAALVEPCAADGCPSATPELLIAPRGRTFGRPITLDRPGRGYDAALAIDPSGRVLVAWDRDGGVYARFVSTRGRLAPVQRLGTEAGPSSFDAVLSADGRAAVGWTSQKVEAGAATSPFTATLSLAGPGRRFGSARLLTTIPVRGAGRYVPYGGLALSLPAGRPGLAAWSGYRSATYVVQAASITGTRLGTPRTISQRGVDTVLADAAEDPAGAAAILLLPGRQGEDPPGTSQPDGLLAVTHPAGTQAFGPPEQILPGPAYVDGADVAIDAATGRVFATWLDFAGPIGWSVRAPLG